MREKVTVLFWLALMLLFPAVAGAQNYLKCERLEGTNTVKVSYDPSGTSTSCQDIPQNSTIKAPITQYDECPTNIKTSIQQTYINETYSHVTKTEPCSIIIENSDNQINLILLTKNSNGYEKITINSIKKSQQIESVSRLNKISEFTKNCSYTYNNGMESFANICFFISESNQVWSWDTTDPQIQNTISTNLNTCLDIESSLTKINTKITQTRTTKCNPLETGENCTSTRYGTADKIIQSRILYPNSPLSIRTLNCSTGKKFEITLNRDTNQGTETIKLPDSKPTTKESKTTFTTTSTHVIIPPRESGPLAINIKELATKKDEMPQFQDNILFFIEDRYKSFISIGTSSTWIKNNHYYSIKKTAGDKNIIRSEKREFIQELTVSSTYLFRDRSFHDLYREHWLSLANLGITSTFGVSTISTDLSKINLLSSIGIGLTYVVTNNLSLTIGPNAQSIQELEGVKVGEEVKNDNIDKYTKSRIVISPQFTISATPDLFKIITTFSK